MEVDPFSIHIQRKQKKREAFRPVLRSLVEGLASLVEGQRCFADEFGLSYGRVFSDDLESFKGKDSCKVISDWIRGGEEGAMRLKQLFGDLAQHQVALVEAFDELTTDSIDGGKPKKGKHANQNVFDTKADSSRAKLKRQQHLDAHQQMLMSSFVARYAKAREQMRADTESGHKMKDSGNTAVK
ncbi:MAG: hypothetical protein P8103_01635 [Candidatus Thiodiazotropha sp.]